MDTILLANFTKLKKGCLAVDLGCGCGAIPLIWLKKRKDIHITAIELQKSACEMLLRTLKLNELELKVEVINKNIKNLNGSVEFGKYDIVSCNPPYYKSKSGVENRDIQKRIAKIENECTIFDVAKTAYKLLKNRGSLYVCGRPARLADNFEALKRSKIEPKLLQFVKSKNKHEPKLFLLEGKKCASVGLRVLPDVFAEEESKKYNIGE